MSAIEKLVNHILAMKDDAHFNEHPEWSEIVKDAEACKPLTATERWDTIRKPAENNNETNSY